MSFLLPQKVKQSSGTKLQTLSMQQYEQQGAGASGPPSRSIERDSYSASSVASEDVLHELRQPLSAIESLAYYVELTSEDEAVKVQMHRIQAMVMQASSILARAEVQPLPRRDGTF